MSDLICSATNCVNNVEGLCSAINIHISGRNSDNSVGTACKTFALKGLANAISSITNTNVVGEIKQIFDNENIAMSPHINCEANKCRHNSGGMCCAIHVQVYGSGCDDSECTDCETYIQ